MDAVVQAVTDQLVWAVTAVFKFVALGLITIPSTWGIIEWVFPKDSTAKTNHAAAFIANVVAYFGLHACSIVDFGAGPKGYGAAILFGCLSGGLTPLFHDRFMKVWAPGLTKSNGTS